MLRHRGRDVTSIYAKVDRLALAAVVQPWPGSRGMSTLAEHVENYLTVRRALGFKLVGEGRAARRVRRVRRAGRAAHGHDRVRAAVGADARQAAAATISRGGCGRSAPSRGTCTRSTLPARSRRSSCSRASKYRPAPYLYSRRGDRRVDGSRRRAEPAVASSDVPDADRAAGVHRAADRRSAPAWTATTSTSPTRVLTVRDSKFGKSREVLLHPSTVQALVELRRAPRPALPTPQDAELLRSPRAGPGPRTPRSTSRSARC